MSKKNNNAKSGKYFCSECSDTGLNFDTDHFSRLPCRACGGSGKRKALELRREQKIAAEQKKATDAKCKELREFIERTERITREN
jgi:hypothetical protein